MSIENIPSTPKILFASMLTMTRKSKMGKEDFKLTKTFNNVFIDQKNLKKYADFFGYKHPLPLSYLFTIALKSQLALMIDKSFPFPLPGMVHLTNQLDFTDIVNVNEPLKLVVSVMIPAKLEGSLFPELKVDFYQKNILVAKCVSGYIVKRKNKNAIKKEEKPKDITIKLPVLFSEKINLANNAGWQYAKVGGDFNPIHISKFFAKASGFKNVIMHGWFSASKAAAIYEAKTGVQIKSLQVSFKNPITLPSNEVFDFREELNGSTSFVCSQDGTDDTYFLEGFVK